MKREGREGGRVRGIESGNANRKRKRVERDRVRESEREMAVKRK